MASTPDPSAGEKMQDGEAYLIFEQLRWGGHPRSCPHCAAAGRSYLLRTSDGTARRTRTGAATARRIWKCGACRRQFSVLTGTVLQGTRVPLPAWIAALDLLCTGDHEVTAAEVGAATGLTPEAARRVIARWRAAAEVEPLRSVTTGGRQLFQG